MKVTLTAREQRTLVVGGLLAVIVLYVYTVYIVGPLVQEGAQLGQQVRSAQDQLRTLEIATANAAALQAQYQRVGEAVTAMKRVMPSEKELPAVIELLSDLANQADVKIQTISPIRPLPAKEEGAGAKAGSALKFSAGQKAPPMPAIFKDILIQIDALAGYHQFGTFLSLVEIRDQPMQLSSLKISTDPAVAAPPQIKLVLHAFFASEGEHGGAEAVAKPAPDR